ncbi:para-nitrobenzyl esterase [Chryseolinea serpens]|uniref:Carboxylic ester hydrolase n=1 Tax=Chryseolinea serpens TaxID=947013 RepID=A0A1M5TCF7_9BACT|nr:carboxylesterase family protein [Chryseolinea serpens]SHH48457.1 para-nitrobenzyl esterase [Chryseolinea serpens]
MNRIGRRDFLSRLSLATAALSIPNYARSSSIKPDEFAEVETSHGRIRGIRKGGLSIFRGIPYAGRISGDRRFRRPAPLEPWKGVRDAIQLGAPSIQPPNQTRGENEPRPAEDCLFLNIWTPGNDNKKRPVMFYNHGGGFATGSGGAVDQDGSNLARSFDVVVVETNHRLGIMGYLYLDEIAGSDYTGSGNMGMLDIVAGLAWVNKNIAAFGGDPNNVMIWGESGGGAKTSCLYAMPEAAPYFNKASIESGPGVRMIPREVASEMTAIVLQELNISPKDWRKLLEVPVADLLSIQQKMPQLLATRNGGRVGFVPGSFSPVVDGIALPHHPFDPSAPEISRNKPLMTGWNEDEFTFFAMAFRDTDALKLTTDFEALQTKMQTQFGADTKRIIDTYRQTRPKATAADVWIAVTSINMMGLGTLQIAERKVQQGGAPVYLYNFGYKSEAKVPGTDYAFGTPHAMDITFKFNNEVPGGQPGFLSGGRPERSDVSHTMAEMWATFARTGKPGAKNAPEWPAYNLTDRPLMRIDSKCEVLKNRFHDELAMWKSIGKL